MKRLFILKLTKNIIVEEAKYQCDFRLKINDTLFVVKLTKDPSLVRRHPLDPDPPVSGVGREALNVARPVLVQDPDLLPVGGDVQCGHVHVG